MMTEEDKSIFLSEMGDVTPLKGNNKVDQYDQSTIDEQAKTTIRKVKKKLKQSTHEAQTVEKQDQHKHFPSVTSFEKVLYHQKGLRLQELNKLKKGEFRVQAELDLHGYIREEAQLLLHDFIASTYGNQLRFVRIIHGKGYNSDETYPVIKNLVNQELRNLKAVLAFCSAPEKDGGTGAVNVFLKAH
ncbi:MAG: hypothetical protein ISEC1_P1315 [Thiomicrorhabdus sp.]|nr:MAG: hypothetical protein ISEC1_P1315 [Thiomicrorhabdus sp.]